MDHDHTFLLFIKDLPVIVPRSMPEELLMMKKHVADIALQMGMKLPKVVLVDGRTLGCRDISLLNISLMGCIASALIYPADLRDMEAGVVCAPLELRIRAALTRLQMLIEAKTTGTSHYFGGSDNSAGDVEA